MAGFSWLSVTTKVMWGSLLPTRDDETQSKGRVSGVPVALDIFINVQKTYRCVYTIYI